MGNTKGVSKTSWAFENIVKTIRWFSGDLPVLCMTGRALEGRSPAGNSQEVSLSRLFVLFCLLWDKILLCSPVWPETNKDAPVSASLVWSYRCMLPTLDC